MDFEELIEEIKESYRQEVSGRQSDRKEFEATLERYSSKIDELDAEVRKLRSSMRELVADCDPETAVANAKKLLEADRSVFCSDGLVNRNSWLEIVAHDLSERLRKAGLSGEWPRPPRIPPWVSPPWANSLLSKQKED